GGRVVVVVTGRRRTAVVATARRPAVGGGAGAVVVVVSTSAWSRSHCDDRLTSGAKLRTTSAVPVSAGAAATDSLMAGAWRRASTGMASMPRHRARGTSSRRLRPTRLVRTPPFLRTVGQHGASRFEHPPTSSELRGPYGRSPGVCN